MRNIFIALSIAGMIALVFGLYIVEESFTKTEPVEQVSLSSTTTNQLLESPQATKDRTQEKQIEESLTATSTTTYSDSVLNITFDYPASWGPIESSSQEFKQTAVQKSLFRFKFNGLVSEGGGGVHFLAIQGIEAEVPATEAYWGHFVYKTAESKCDDVGVRCFTNKNGLTVAEETHWTWGCENDSPNLPRAKKYTVSTKSSLLTSAMVFSDERIALKKCEYYDEKAGESFRQMVDSLRYSN